MGILRRGDLLTQTCLGSPKHIGRGVPAGEWPGDKLRKFKSSLLSWYTLQLGILRSEKRGRELSSQSIRCSPPMITYRSNMSGDVESARRCWYTLSGPAWKIIISWAITWRVGTWYTSADNEISLTSYSGKYYVHQIRYRTWCISESYIMMYEGYLFSGGLAVTLGPGHCRKRMIL